MRKLTRSGGLFLFVLTWAVLGGCGVKPAPFTNPLESRLILQMPFYADERGGGGPAALAAVMTYNGRPTTVEEVVMTLGDKPPLAQAMAIMARQAELKADFYMGNPDQLVEAVKQNQPLIVRLDLPKAPVNAGDYAVVVGYTPDGPVVNSCAVNQQIVAWRDFLAGWHAASYLTLLIEPLE